jgi:hypothetical protein
LSNTHRPEVFLLDILKEGYRDRKVLVICERSWRGEDRSIKVASKDVVIRRPVSSKKVAQWRVRDRKVEKVRLWNTEIYLIL